MESCIGPPGVSALNYAKVKDKPGLLQSLTGLTPQAFAQSLAPFRRAYEEDLDRRDAQRPTPRQRRRGGGRKATLATIEDKLLFILLYVECYPTQEALAQLFGFGQPQANEWIHRLTPVLNAALGYEKQLPARKAVDLAQVLAECPELKSI